MFKSSPKTTWAGVLVLGATGLTQIGDYLSQHNVDLDTLLLGLIAGFGFLSARDD